MDGVWVVDVGFISRRLTLSERGHFRLFSSNSEIVDARARYLRIRLVATTRALNRRMIEVEVGDTVK